MRRADGLYSNFVWGLTGERQEMLVENGRVAYRRPAGAEPKPGQIDLGGRFVYPSFIDAHCHILPTGLDLQKLHLGACSTRAEVLDAVRDAERELAPGKWLMAVHYDQTKFPDGEHLTLRDLDPISPERPVLLRHVSGHASVANSAALRAAGIGDDTPDPEGGTFRRGADGWPDGVLLEHAHDRVTAASPDPTLEEMVEAILLAGERMADLGIACASDMMTGRFDLDKELRAYRLAAERGCRIRTRLYLQWGAVFGPRNLSWSEVHGTLAGLDPGLCRIGGIKIFADGAIGSATAAIYGRYSGHPPNPAMVLSRSGRSAASVAEDVEVDGQLIYPPERLRRMVRIAHDSGYPMAIHSIGDYSTDLVMDAYEELGDASRHRIEHAMLLSDAQIERMARLRCRCTMQPEFLMRFAHAYKKQLGPERAARLKRFRSVIDAGIPLSLNSDRPIVAGDPRDGIRTAVRRPAGFELAENVTLNEAILAYTAQAAGSNDDEDEMGSLTEGQLGDFQVLDEPIGA